MVWVCSHCSHSRVIRDFRFFLFHVRKWARLRGLFGLGVALGVEAATHPPCVCLFALYAASGETGAAPEKCSQPRGWLPASRSLAAAAADSFFFHSDSYILSVSEEKRDKYCRGIPQKCRASSAGCCRSPALQAASFALRGARWAGRAAAGYLSPVAGLLHPRRALCSAAPCKSSYWAFFRVYMKEASPIRPMNLMAFG